jgi:hypothetical protein
MISSAARPNKLSPTTRNERAEWSGAPPDAAAAGAAALPGRSLATGVPAERVGAKDEATSAVDRLTTVATVAVAVGRTCPAVASPGVLLGAGAATAGGALVCKLRVAAGGSPGGA